MSALAAQASSGMAINNLCWTSADNWKVALFCLAADMVMDLCSIPIVQDSRH